MTQDVANKIGELFWWGTAFVFTFCITGATQADIQPAFGCPGRAVVGTYQTSGGDNGPAVGAQLFQPAAMAHDSHGNVYIVDGGNENVRKVDSKGIITTIAGNGVAATSGDGGPAVQASLNNPHGIAVDSKGNIYISESSGNRIRRITPDGTISTIAGNGRAGFSGDGTAAAQAMLWRPGWLAIDALGNLFVSDMGNFRLRKIAPDGTISTVAGAGPRGNGGDPDGLAATSLYYDGDIIAVAPNGDLLIQLTSQMMIASIDSSGMVHDVTGPFGTTALAAEGASARTVAMGAGTFTTEPDGSIIISAPNAVSLWQILPDGSLHQLVANFGIPGGMAVLPDSTILASFEAVYAFSKSGQRTVFAGTPFSFNDSSPGLASSAQLKSIGGMAADKSGNLYISDTYSNRILRVTPDGRIGPFAGTGDGTYSGDGGPASQAGIGAPMALAFDPSGNLYVAQNFGGTIVRKIALDGTITHFAGNGTFSQYCGLGCDVTGLATKARVNAISIASDTRGQIYLLDLHADVIWKVDLQGNISTFLWAVPYLGGPGSGGERAQIQTDGADNVYFSVGDGALIVTSPAGKPTTPPAPGVGQSLAVDPKGDVYMATLTGKLLTSSPSGVTSTLWDLPLSPNSVDKVFPITLDSLGNLFFADQTRRIVFEIPNATSCTGAQHPLVSADGAYNAASYVAATGVSNNLGHYFASAVAPGELVTFFGNYLGPSIPAGPSVIGNRFDTQAGGARVLFDGIPAPILYASQNQISAVVPYEIAGQALTQVTVELNGAISDNVNEAVVEAFSGIFTANSSGNGQAAVLNSDGKPNTASHPAAKGSAITFFATGAGITTPPSVDGVIAGGSPPPPVLLVSVFIDGQPAKVLYAGGAPFEINGVMQVNAVVPQEASSGPNVTLQLQVGNEQPSPFATQPRVTIAVQ